MASLSFSVFCFATEFNHPRPHPTPGPIQGAFIAFGGVNGGGARRIESAQLKWGKVTEAYNSHFDIECSAGGLYFEKTRTIAGAGNSAVRQNYLFQHMVALPGHHYFRLRPVDFDGRSDCSPLRAIVDMENKNTGLRVFSNPFSGEAISFQFKKSETQKFSIQILNASGQIEANCFFENIEIRETLPLPGAEKVRHGQYSFPPLRKWRNDDAYGTKKINCT